MQKSHSITAVPFQAITDKSQACRIQLFNPSLTHEPGRLRIHVLFTNAADTRRALRAAVRMASEMESEIALLVPQIVPYPLPIDNPPVPLDFASTPIRRLAESVEAQHAKGEFIVD